jgi:hypothetical protein
MELMMVMHWISRMVELKTDRFDRLDMREHGKAVCSVVQMAA